jgi:hypothetical protein
MTIRTVRLGCITAAMLIAGAVLVGPVLAAPGDSAPLPTNYAGVATVSGVFEHADSQPGVAPTSQPFYASFGDGNSTYAAQSLLAEASPYNPGATVTGLPGLICTAGGPCSGLPSYPLVATANTQTPSASVTFTPEVGPPGGPLSVASLAGTAHAAQATGVSTQAEVGGLGEQQGSTSTAAAAATLARQLTVISGRPVAASSSALLGIGSITGTTSQEFKGSVLTVTAEAVDSDISLLSGIIHIGSITTTSISTSDGYKVHTHVDTAAAHNVTVGGIPASIGQNGVTISGSALGGAQVLAANAALQQALAASGMQIHFLGDTSGPGVLQPQTCLNGEADGLQMHVSANITPVPTVGAVYFDDIALGSACTSATVAPADAATATPVSTVPPATVPSGSVTGSPNGTQSGSAGSFVATGPAVVPGSSATNGLSTPATGGGSLPPASPNRQNVTRFEPGLEAQLGTHLVAERISLLYAVFVLTAVAVLLGAKPFVKPRLPRST